MNQDAFFGDVGDVDRISALIEDIAEGHVHAAFRSEAHAGLFACFMEALAVVQIKLGHAVVVGDEQVGMAGAAQIRCGGCKRPATAVDSDLRADFFKLAVAQIVEEIFAAAVLGILKTVRHHARGVQMPQVDVLGIVAADKEIEQSVAVVVEPDSRVRIDPLRAGRPAR